MTRAESTSHRSWPSLLGFVSVVACLYLGRDFLLPLVLAALLSFLLAPLCEFLERRGLKRGLAVTLSALLAFAVIGALMYIVASQLIDFAADLPKYRTNLLAKVGSLREQSAGPFRSAMETVEEIVAAMNPQQNQAAVSGVAPVPVVIQHTDGTASLLKSILLPLLSPIGTAVIVAVVSIFMLMGREDLRDRIIHLVGRGHMHVTTEALDEAGQRVSRYLFAQLVVNTAYGCLIALGLSIAHVPNAALWGILAGVLRFLPYIGPWLGAFFPLCISLAASPGWNQFLLTVAIFIVVEITVSNVVEPWLYGASTGISPMAVIVSAVFWAWLWGGAGLLLATPLTVCVAVAGKYVPGLGYLDVLLGEKPPISRSERLYQRLLTLDEDETAKLAEEAIKKDGLPHAADQVLLPALQSLEHDARNGVLPADLHDAAHGLLREVCEGFAPAAPKENTPVLCLPALNDTDELPARLLSEALNSRGVAAHVPSSKLLVSETLDVAASSGAAVICVVSFLPTSSLVAANLCHRLKERAPSAHVTALLWQKEEHGFSRRREKLKRRGAYDAFFSIENALSTLTQLAGCHPVPNGKGELEPALSAAH
jgi:predicted PurR-regulated permease PerM